MMKLVSKLLGLIYPEPIKCDLCERELAGFEVTAGVCKKCLGEFKLFTGEGISGDFGVCYDLVQGLALYEGIAKDLIHRLKYHGERNLVYPLVDLMFEQYQAVFKKERWDGIIPVPLHEKRLHERGYNQSLLLAEGLAFYLSIPCVDCFQRVKETLPQNQLNVSERRHNLSGAFVLKENIEIAGGHWLIVDDIFTTGATVNELAKMLKRAGSKRVGVYVVASGRKM